MFRLNPEKLSVDFREGISPAGPIVPRRYTLTHSDETAQLFLTIGARYAADKISPLRDEVIGEWVPSHKGYTFHAAVLVDGQNPEEAPVRNYIFRRELPLALEAIRYGDRQFLNAHPSLLSVPIIIHFRSNNPQFHKTEFWGSFSDYGLNRGKHLPI